MVNLKDDEIILAFYKASDSLFDRLTRWWTKSKYSHVEIIIDDVWYSSSSWDGGVRRKAASKFQEENWDFVVYRTDDKYNIKTRLLSQAGKEYDYFGLIMTQILPMTLQQDKKWFCSELVAWAIPLREKSYTYSPQDVYHEVVLLGKYKL